MHGSEFFPRTGKDAPSRFWTAYERVAKQHDDELIERHNGEMDVLLIFVRATVFGRLQLNGRHRSGWSVLGCELCIHREHAIELESKCQ